jgi:hypothetical protein
LGGGGRWKVDGEEEAGGRPNGGEAGGRPTGRRRRAGGRWGGGGGVGLGGGGGGGGGVGGGGGCGREEGEQPVGAAQGVAWNGMENGVE